MKTFGFSHQNNTANSSIEKNNDQKPRIILLTSSLLVDRVFLYTNLIKSLDEFCDVTIWATSKENDQYTSIWNEVNVKVESFPKIKPFMEVPHNYLRRLNEFAWDYQFTLPSRMSMLRHVRNKSQRASVKALKIPAWLIAKLHLEKHLENAVEKMMLGYPRSPDASNRFQIEKPTVIVSTGPFQYEQPAIFSAAKKLGIPTLAYIPSWDNITTKNRLVYKYDGYIVWSEQTKKELHEFYPATRSMPVYIVGAPQFDIFLQEKFYQSREEFCKQQKLDPNLPIIVYALGSPNFLQEHHGAIELAKQVVKGELGKVQMVVRPHPIHDNAEMEDVFKRFEPMVQLQKTPNAGITLNERSQDKNQIIEWINTFRHADVVINLSSTVTVDAAIFDKPIVNLDFDPQPSRADQELIKDINHKWNHFKPIAESDGVWLVNDFDEMKHAVRTYLKNPNLHHAKRKWITNYVCGYLDGKCGDRMARAIKDFSERHKLKSEIFSKTEINAQSQIITQTKQYE
jgi:hypothetical protein